ncbi:MAG TPA: asparagine synthase (glutamine-hydrolyzing), partial [Gemmatimonadales bacterium]|nr:asparagine synthase (glutamine-hydrolyzing) [Gemmatimonadales bacterium]
MCGIAGFLSRSPLRNAEECVQLATAMATGLEKRGPDGSGTWVDPAAGVALSHRRLAILDLSEQGGQPMLSGDGRYVIVLNGEIYNHRQLREELGSSGSVPQWRGRSDVEVALAAFSRWGVREALQRFIGMFAFVLWDRRERELWLARDRMGEKPLYYGRLGPDLVFASQLNAFRAHPAWHTRIVDRAALQLFMRYGYVPSPYSIYEGMRKLPPASVLRIRTADGARNGEALVPERYWDLAEVATRGRSTPFEGTAVDASVRLEELLRSVVRDQMVADVPLGAFLSGGVDSSSVVALMQKESARRVRTFTIGLEEPGFDEAPHAQAVAQHLGTEHTALYVSASDALAVIPQLPEIYDEPFADPTQVATTLLARLARRHVTVSLSGEGGDEIFGGYNRYLWAFRVWRAAHRLPVRARSALQRILRGIAPQTWDRVFEVAGPLLGKRYRYGSAGEKVHRGAAILDQDARSAYLRLVEQWDSAAVVLGAPPDGDPLPDNARINDHLDFTERMMCLDGLTYLPDDVLVNVDRAAMAASLETRAPFLDHRVVEFAWTLPLSLKIHEGTGKAVLRSVLYRHVPQRLLMRPKMGFGVPIAAWLRGPLRE